MLQIQWIVISICTFLICVTGSSQQQLEVTYDLMEKLLTRLEYVESKLAEQVEEGVKQKFEIDNLTVKLANQIEFGLNEKAELNKIALKLTEQVELIAKQKMELDKFHGEFMVNLDKIKTKVSRKNMSHPNAELRPPALIKDKVRENIENETDVFDKPGESQITKDHTHIGIRQEETFPVAFTAYLDHNVIHLGTDQVIKYDKVLVNVGDAYNRHTGIFLCPVDGLYVMNFVVSTYGQQQIFAKLVVDDVNQLDAVADTIQADHDAQGGNLMVLSLTQGQSVWVASYGATDTSVDGSTTVKLSSFSGFLLQ